jgi:hypothetical protein
VKQGYQVLLFAALMISLVSLAYGLNYMYFSDIETTTFGERIRFWHGDTLQGPVHSNDQIGIMQDPQFYDEVTQSGPWSDFLHGTGYNPTFHGPAPIFGAPRIGLPTSATWIRPQAVAQGHYFNEGDSMMARVHIEGDSLRIWWTHLEWPFDTNAFTFHALPESAIVFFDCPVVHLWGTVSTNLVFGCAGRAGLENNILYTSSNAAQHGQPAPNHPEKFALVAEGEIKILNTWANGREDSHNLGNNQTNPDSTDIYLNGFYFALGGSFTFEQQNDPDSGYVYQDPPGTTHMDDRGTIWLWGGITQRQRGYTHRSNNISTGYLKHFRYDPQIEFWNVGAFDLMDVQIGPTSLNYGSVLVGDTARDTVWVFNGDVPVQIDSVVVPLQFGATFQWGSAYVAFIPDHARHTALARQLL